MGRFPSSSSRQRWLVVSGVTVAVVWIVVLLLDDSSVLGILVRRVPTYIGWAHESPADDVVRRMHKYERKGRYDDAIKAGVAWTQQHPDADSSVWNGWIYTGVSALYLKKAARDGEDAELDIQQALLYRDRAVPFSTESLYAMQRLAAISESAGDLSAPERCVQYRNTMKLLDRANILLTEEKDRMARQIKPNPADCEQNEVCFGPGRHKRQSREGQTCAIWMRVDDPVELVASRGDRASVPALRLAIGRATRSFDRTPVTSHCIKKEPSNQDIVEWRCLSATNICSGKVSCNILKEDQREQF